MTDERDRDSSASRSSAVAEGSGEASEQPAGKSSVLVAEASTASARLPEPELPGAGTPEGEALRRARDLFFVGDHAEMRRVLLPLTKSSDPAIADAAERLMRRIAVDPVQIGFLVGCLFAILGIAYAYLGR